jgi:hypothetical protein
VADKLTRTIAADGSLVTTITTDTPICDFCCDRSKPVHWYFNATDAVMQEMDAAPAGAINAVFRYGKVVAETTKKMTLESIGGRWAACDECRGYVERHDALKLSWVAAVQYTINNRIEQLTKTVLDEIHNGVAEVQQAFWKNWDQQPATPWTVEQ